MLRSLLFGVILTGFASFAVAQQVSPSSVALQVNNTVSQLALALEQSQRDLAVAREQIKELEQQCGDKCKAAAN